MAKSHQDVVAEWVRCWGDPNARGKGSRIFYEGPVIYSYGHHYQIARYVVREDTGQCVLFNPHNYSVSTAKHRNYVRRTLPSWIKVFHVDPRGDHTRHLHHYLGELRELEGTIAKARTRKRKYQERAIAIHDEMLEYARFFQLDWPMSEDVQATLTRYRIESGFAGEET